MTPTSCWSVNTNIPLILEETYPELSGSGEIFAIFMETNGHHPVSGIKSFLYSVSMMYIDVDVKHTIVISSRLLIGCLWRTVEILLTLVVPEYLIQCLHTIISHFPPGFFGLTINIAESTCFTLFSMVKATSPIYCNVTFIATKPSCTLWE